MRIEQKALENSVFVPAFEGGQSAANDLLYFYHFGKTGGTSVGAYLQTMAWVRNRTAVLVDESVRSLPGLPVGGMPHIVFGHTVYGDHHICPGTPDLIAIMRDPVHRIVSEYFWTHRLEDLHFLEKPESFTRFLDKVAEHDYLTRRMLGREAGVPLSADLALERLAAFKYVTTTPYLTRLLCVIGSAHGMPSLWLEMGKTNPNNVLKAELANRFADEIRTRNCGDSLLFDYAEGRRAEIDETYRQLTKQPQRPTKLITMHVTQELDRVHEKKARIARGKAVMVLDMDNHTIAKSGAENRMIQFGTSAKIPEAGLREFLKALPKEPNYN